MTNHEVMSSQVPLRWRLKELRLREVKASVEELVSKEHVSTGRVNFVTSTSRYNTLEKAGKSDLSTDVCLRLVA